MSNSPQLHIPTEQLLAHADYLRRLAHGLVYERHADDLMQQTWVRALEHPPAHDANIPGWLATVAKSVAMLMRQQRARAERDHTLEPGVTFATSTDEIVERIEVQTLVNEIMLTLPQTLRDVVLLRYFEDLKPNQMAQRLGISAATVRNRLQKGLETVRTALERRYAAGERDWCAGFALMLTQPGDGDVPASVGAERSPSSASKRAVATMALIAAAALMATLFITREHPTPAPSSTREVARNEPEPAPMANDRQVVAPAPRAPEGSIAVPASAPSGGARVDTASLADLFRRLLENGRKPEFQDFPWSDVELFVERASSALMSNDSEPIGETAWRVTLPSDDLSFTLTRSEDATLGPTLALEVDPSSSMTFDSPFTAQATKLTLVAHQEGGHPRLELTLETGPEPNGLRTDSPEPLQTGAMLELSHGPSLTVSPTTHSAAGRLVLSKRTPEPAATSASPEIGPHVWQSLAQVFCQPKREARHAVGLTAACNAFFDAMATEAIAPTIASQLIDSLSQLESQTHTRPYSMMGVDYQQVATGPGDPIVLFRQRESDGLETVEVVLQRLAFPTKSGTATVEIVLSPGYRSPLDLTFSVEVDHQQCYVLELANDGLYKVVRTERSMNGTRPTPRVQTYHLPADFEPASAMVERLEAIFANK